MVDCILAGAARVLATAPLSATTTNHIADVAGVSIGSLYQYFRSKDAIGLALVERHLTETVRLVGQVRSASRGLRAELRFRMQFDEVLRDHHSAPGLHRNLFVLGKTLRPREAVETLVAQIVADIVAEVAAMLREERPEADEEHIHLCATLGLQTAAALVHSRLARTSPKDARECYDGVTATNLRWLGSRQGTVLHSPCLSPWSERER
jgi:AcrR family transcriptional regulator